MPVDLTELQSKVLCFIIGYTLRNLYQPSWREIAFEMEMNSTNEVTTVIDALIKKNYLGKHEDRRTPRALHIRRGGLWHFFTSEPDDSKLREIARSLFWRRQNLESRAAHAASSS